jgi:RNA polymerase sigma factor (sigma-70 family)
MTVSTYKQIGRLCKSQNRVEANLRLVVFFAKKYAPLGILSFDDLISEGTIGLVRADQLHVEEKGKFSSYAGQWIKAMMLNAINSKKHLVHVPTNKKEVKTFTEEATPINVKESVANDAFAEEPQNEMAAKVAKLIATLKPKQAKVVQMAFGIGYPREYKTTEIAEAMGLTVQMVTGHLRNALAQMKSSI